MIMHQERYLEYIRTQGVGDKDQVASSPKSYVSYLNGASKLIGRAISPEILHSLADIDSIANRLAGLRAKGTVRNCRSAMRHYVAMVQAYELYPGSGPKGL